MSNNKSNEVRTFDSKFWWIFIPFLLIITLIFFFPYWLTQFHLLSFDFEKTGQIGDTLGGTMGPFIAIAAAILTFFAFWVQYKANEQQRIDLKIERFESKFYSLVEIHRSNLNEITIGSSLTGRKAFISMFNEMKFTYWAVHSYYNLKYKKIMPSNEISEDVLYNVSYLIFFFGVGTNSSPIVSDLIGRKYVGFFLAVEEYIKGNQKTWHSERKQNKSIDILAGDAVFELDINYMPCDGHISRLSHYIRHLFQLVRYVEDADERIFPYDAKYNYLTTIRSQLSPHEQLIIFYNALSILGSPWMESPNYLKKYCIVKSIPLQVADFYKRPIDVLGEKNEQKKVMFEWLEIKNRLK